MRGGVKLAELRGARVWREETSCSWYGLGVWSWRPCAFGGFGSLIRVMKGIIIRTDITIMTGILKAIIVMTGRHLAS